MRSPSCHSKPSCVYILYLYFEEQYRPPLTSILWAQTHQDIMFQLNKWFFFISAQLKPFQSWMALSFKRIHFSTRSVRPRSESPRVPKFIITSLPRVIKNNTMLFFFNRSTLVAVLDSRAPRILYIAHFPKRINERDYFGISGVKSKRDAGAELPASVSSCAINHGPPFSHAVLKTAVICGHCRQSRLFGKLLP